MTLEEEAQEHIKASRNKFLNELADYMESVEVFICDNLWESHERDNALKAYTEMYLWARQCSDLHGVK